MRKKLSFLAATAASLLLLVVGLSCRDNPIGPRYPGKVNLSIAPSAASAGSQAALPINLIRLTATEAGEAGKVLAQNEATVDPNATEWALEFNVPVRSGSASILLSVELLNQPSGGGAATVQWSALAGPLDIEAGRTSQVSNLTLGCGPLTNRGIAGVNITSQVPSQVVEGSDVTLAATAEGGTAAAVFIWSSLDAAVATVDPAGKVHTLRDGSARVVACAGAHADTIPLTVVQRPAAIVVSPTATVTLTSIDAEATFTAQVNDPRGAAVPGVTVQWASSDVQVATHVANGRFRAVKNGSTQAIATIAGVQGVQGTGNITVAQAPASVDITQPSLNLATVGSTATLGFTVRDATQHAIPGATVTWLSRNTGVATITNAGVVTAVAIGATRVVATAAPSVADSIDVTVDRPRVSLALQAGVDKVSLGRSAVVNLTLNQPAPAGGVTITVTSASPNVLNIDAPNPITIAAGGTAGSVTVNGLAEGTSQLTATASVVYDPGNLTVAVEPRVLSLQTPFSVPYGQTAALPIQLARPAPAGGLPVTVTTSDANVVGINTPTVTIPAGALSANAILAGAKPGTATISVSHPLYTGASSVVTSAASLNVTVGSIGFNESFGANILIRFESNGVPVPAPAPGVAITLAAIDPACVTVQPTATIPTGLVDVSVPLTYAGPPKTTPCSSFVRASATDIAPDSVNATVNPKPLANVTGATVGAGLQRSMSGNLAATNHPGVTVHLTSPDPARLLIAANATTVGTASLDIDIPPGSSFFSYVVQAVEGQQLGTVTVTSKATGFADDTAQIDIVQPAFDVGGLPQSINTLDPDDPFFVRIGIPSGGASPAFIQEYQSLRTGGQPVTAVIRTSAAATVSTLVTPSGPAQSASVQIAPGEQNSPISVTQGGVAHRPVGSGTTTITTTMTGFIATTSPNAGGSIQVTITTPSITVSPVAVGSGLMRQHSGFLGASNHGGATVTITSREPDRIRVSKDATTEGATSTVVTLPQSVTTFTFYVHGVEGATGADVVLDVTEPRFNPATFTVTPVQPAFEVAGILTSTNTLAADDQFFIRVGIPNSAQNPAFLNEFQPVRFNAPQPVIATITSSATAVATLVSQQAPLPGAGSVTVQIPAGSFNSPSTIATGGAALHPVGGGTTTIRSAIPGFLGLTSTTSGASIDVTVSAPTMSINTENIGSGLMRFVQGFLSTPAPAGTVVHLTSQTPGTALLALNTTTAPAVSIDVPVSTGFTSFSFNVHGLEGKTGPVSITASAPGYTGTTGTANIVQGAFDLQGVITQPTTFDVDDPFTVRVGVPQSGGVDLFEVQAVRFGAPPLTVSLNSKVPSIGQLVTTAGPSSSVTVQIAAGDFSSPFGVANGGVAFDPVLNGTTTIRTSLPGFIAVKRVTTGDSIDVIVSPPKITVTPVTVGAGLQQSTSFSLTGSGHGPVTLHIESSQPSVALVAPTATAQGQASFDTTITASTFGVSFVVHGVVGAVGTPTVTVTANGYTQGIATATIVAPAVDIGGLNLNPAAGDPDDVFIVRLGIPSPNGTLINEYQTRSVNAGPLTVTVTSSNTAAGGVKTNSMAGPGTVSLQVLPGQFLTPGSFSQGGVVFDPVAAGTTLVQASAPGFATTTDPQSGGRQTVIVRP